MFTAGTLNRLNTAGTVVSLAALTGLAWLYLFDTAADMDAMMATMPDMPTPTWDAAYGLTVLLMWAIMMVGMMLPSASPAILIYQGIARKAARDGQTVAPTWLFTSGYLLVWMLFSASATFAQWQLNNTDLLSPMMVSSSAVLGSGLLIAAGLYQWTPVKNTCLRHCRSPVEFISSHWRKGRRGALLMGWEHGLYCLGCCWVLMTLLFVGGVMNLLWIALISIFVLAEKLLPYGDWAGKLVGGLMIAAGIALPFYS